MNTLIFEYKGFIGATTDTKNGEFINDINSSNEFGCVIASKNVDISPEAKKLIKETHIRGTDDLEPLMFWKDSDGFSYIGIMGFERHNLGNPVTISHDSDLSVLDGLNEVDIDAPDEYKIFIDKKG